MGQTDLDSITQSQAGRLVLSKLPFLSGICSSSSRHMLPVEAADHKRLPSDCSVSLKMGKGPTVGQSEPFSGISALGLVMEAAPFLHRCEFWAVWLCPPLCGEAGLREREKMTSRERSRWRQRIHPEEVSILKACLTPVLLTEFLVTRAKKLSCFAYANWTYVSVSYD